MAVRIAQASRGESGYTNQQAGNQTGSELNIRTWHVYANGGWDTLIRPKSPDTAEKIARAFEQAVKNPNIGYDMNLSDRRSLFAKAKAAGWDISKITEKCECDCSSLATTAINCAGVKVSEWAATGTMAAVCQATGQFDILRSSKYLTTDEYLKRGDLLMNSAHHICCVLDDGKYTKVAFTPYIATITVQTHLKVRTGPGTMYPEFMLDGGDGTWTPWRFPPAAQVVIVEENSGWGRIGNTVGWISLSWTKKNG